MTTRHNDTFVLLRALFIAIATLFIIAAFGIAQERVDLSAPIVKSASTCTLDTVLLDVRGNRIVANLICPGNDPIVKQYDSFTTPTGAALLHNLNTANFSTNSLVKAVYNRLLADGVIAGVVNGTPQ